MPKVVDHDARRLEIADALLAVVRREGVAAVSVRTVAAEAGLSVGAMRHTAASQGELLAFAMGVVAERVAGRVAARAAAGPADLDALTDVLGEVLPLDAERTAEAAVWVELVTRARTDAALAPVSADAHAGLRTLVATVVAAAVPGAAPERVADEAVALHALLDGLALHAVLHPGSVEPGLARRLVRAHLEGLRSGPGSADRRG